MSYNVFQCPHCRMFGDGLRGLIEHWENQECRYCSGYFKVRIITKRILQGDKEKKK